MVSGTLSIPKHTAGSAGGWIGENQNVPATQPNFGQVRLTARKYAALVPVSNDLLRRASASVDTMVRDDLVADIATATDLAFIRGDGTNGQPKGLKNWAGTTLTANATVNLSNVTDDLGQMIQTLMDSDVRMLRLGWIMEPRTWRYLVTARDSNGNFAFKPEMDRGTLFAFPFRVTTQIPRNLGAGNDTELYLSDFADVVIGEATQVLIDASGETAYHDGSQVVAAFSLDQTVVRAIVEVDLAVRHAESVVVLNGVTWGV
jgi:HK97 family phage major capsid protein